MFHGEVKPQRNQQVKKHLKFLHILTQSKEDLQKMWV